MNQQDRRTAATNALIERMHAAWHRHNGADAACNRCGTTNTPAWLRRQMAKDLTGAVRA